jgi:hypothetical protein
MNSTDEKITNAYIINELKRNRGRENTEILILYFVG